MKLCSVHGDQVRRKLSSYDVCGYVCLRLKRMEQARDVILSLLWGWGGKRGRCAWLLHNGGAARRCLLLEVRFNQALMNSISQVIH